MLKNTSLAFLFAWFVVSAFAQENTSSPTARKSTHYVGVQANQLIRQIFNFSGSNSAVANPYLLTYASNSKLTGWGLNLGLGFTFNEFNESDAFTERKTTVNDLFFRVGFEKKKSFGKRWILSSGIDAVAEIQNNKTRTKPSGSPGGSARTSNKSSGFGLGPRVALNYTITDRMLVGTEATYYLKSIKNKVKSSGDFQPTEETEENLTRFQFAVPSVIYLILTF